MLPRRSLSLSLRPLSLPLLSQQTQQRRSLSYKAPLKEIEFVLNDVFKLSDHYKALGVHETATPETVKMVLEESAKFCETVLDPLNEKADSVGCKHIGKHEVQVPPGFKDAYDQFVSAGWQGMTYGEEYGGQGMPYSLGMFATDLMAAANWTWTMYPGLSKGAINTILAHASDSLKEAYLPKLVAGEWTGTMCLTEPQCGSDLAQVKTTATPNADGKTYKINGTKIFISCGEHNMVPNIIHCVLARLPGAPPGTKGISLFLVPKRKVDAQGNVGDLNGVATNRIEEKMGCHGSSTCELLFEDAEGYLIGQPNRGLNHMFTFINTSRIGTAVQGVAAAERSFQGALWYAKERLAMRSLTGTKFPKLAADPIIEHPDVRRMLLTQKAVAEGGRVMVYECALLADKMQDAERRGDTKTVRQIDDQLGYLTPILKGFLTEMGVEAANLGIQVYGGHGYIKANKQEQVFRDVRIAALWEGTTQIQALDLLGRKVLQHGMKPLHQHCLRVYQELRDIVQNTNTTSVKWHAAVLMGYYLKLQALTVRAALAGSNNADAVGVASVDYLMFSGYCQLALSWLRMENAAAKALEAKEEGSKEKIANEDFYEAKIQASKFVFQHMLPRAKRHSATMFTSVDAIMGLKPQHFSFDHALEK